MRLFNSLTIKKLLIILCSIALSSLALIIFSTIFQLLSIKKELINVAEKDIPLTAMVTEIALQQLEQSIEFERILHYGITKNIDANSSKSFQKFEDAKEAFSSLSNKVNNTFAEAEHFLENITASISQPADKLKLTEFLIKLEILDQSHKKYEQHTLEIVELLDHNDALTAQNLAFSVEQEEKTLNHAIETLLRQLVAFTEAASLKAEEHEKTAIEFVIAIGSVSALLIMIIGFSISKTIIDQINNTRSIIAQIVNGLDLTIRLKSDGNNELSHLGRDLNSLFQTLNEAISKVISSSNQLASASEELSAISIQNAAAVSQQYKEINQVTVAIDELSATASDVARVTNSTSLMVVDTESVVDNGTLVVSKSLSSMQSLGDNINATNSVVEQLNSYSNGIAKVLDTIQSVADQTNLLALNAAIEAARAGEAGRGFAVVAGEVRDLASNTHALTDQIRDQINNLQSGSHKAIDMMQSSQNSAATVLDSSSDANSMLQKISQAIVGITDSNTQISSAAEQQSVVTQEISNNMLNIRNIAMENSCISEQTTKSSEELANLASSLYQTSMQFKVA
jgi:methyl-accepting chemotaxis protein